MHIRTPLIQSMSLSRHLGDEVWLKMESAQPSGSFKIRGVGHACRICRERGAEGFVSSSGGNAGLAVAYAGRRLGVPVTVVVPATTKARAIELIEQEGATVIVRGENWNRAHEHALELAAEDLAYIHPYDDPLIWEGHATVVDEVVEEGLEPDLVVLSVGGGGLLCGVLQGLERHHLEDVSVLAVETVGADSLATALDAGEHVGIDGITSIATSLGAKQVAREAFELARTHDVRSCRMTDAEAVEACVRFLDDHRTLVEPACGASLAPLYGRSEDVAGYRQVLVIVCGGVGVTAQQLEEWHRETG
jgi:L-serine/L-threonine ammonia-lyase